MRSSALIASLLLILCGRCARQIEKHEPLPGREIPTSDEPLRFAHERHLFMEPSNVLVPRALLPGRGGSLTLVPERRRIARVAQTPATLFTIDADSHRVLSSTRFDRPQSLYVDRVDGTVYAIEDEATARSIGASASGPIRWINDPEGHRLYARLQISASRSRILTAFDRVTTIEEDRPRSLIYVADAGMDSVFLFDARTDAIVASHKFERGKLRGSHGPASISFDRQSRTLFVAEGRLADRIAVLDGKTLNVLRTISCPSPFTIVADSAGRRLYVSSFADTRLRVFDAEDGHFLASQKCDETPYVLFIDPKTSIVYVEILEAVVACEPKQGRT